MKHTNSSVFVVALLSAAFFSLLLSFGEVRAQTIPGVTMVSGTYTNSQAGVEITFPEGWEGAAISTDAGLIISVAPGGMSGGTATKGMFLMIMDKSKMDSPPTDPTSFTSDTSSQCGTPLTSTTQVSGVAASQITVECTQDGTPSKARMIIVQTGSRWIAAMYAAPVAEFDSDVSAFDTSVSTLKVTGATDMGASADIGLLKVQSITLGGKSLQVDVKSSSTISDFKLDESSKTLTFKADGQTGTQGKTEIAIGKMLNGPYTVKIDGKATTDFQVAGAGADAMMTVSYTHSSHDVAVTGASIVPEFPIAVVGVIAGLIGIVAVIGRTRLFRTGTK
ncbi:MAG TPA: hypothetical protein VGQ13_00320 [Nitrososphaera sp.]|nr:hypothetical protein [Nitrososphaera sp.]